MRKLLAAALCCLVVTTGCGAKVERSEDAKSAAVTLTNCGREVTYEKVPERVVTNDVGITELMLALGLEDRMAGFAMPDDKGDLSDVPWKDGYDKVRWLSKDQLTKENVLDARADLVFVEAGTTASARKAALPPRRWGSSASPRTSSRSPAATAGRSRRAASCRPWTPCTPT